MAIDKTLAMGSAPLMLLKLLESSDMYGYQMIEELKKRSDDTFALKAGTLYPLLHDMEAGGLVLTYERTAETGRIRKYYSLTEDGRAALAYRVDEWKRYSSAVNRVLSGGELVGAN